MKNIAVLGGAGYVGSLLVPQLIKFGYNLFVYDTFWFNQYCKESHNLKADVRDIEKLKLFFKSFKIDAIINLACISNDASFELDEELSKSINLDAFEPLVIAAKNAGIKRFIHASTSSVYGISDAINITEEHPLVPLTLYNKYKAMTEPLLLKHTTDEFKTVIIRPATICGYSPRLRLDLTVNIFVNHAITNKEIKVFGGNQLRPNLHISDMCDLYQALVELPDYKFPNGEIYNYGAANYSIKNIAKLTKAALESNDPTLKPIKLSKIKSNDHRSYHICSDKIFYQLGLRPKKSIIDAIDDLYYAFDAGLVPNSMTDTRYFNVKHLQKLGIK